MPESDAYSIKEVDIPKGFAATYKQSGYVFTVTNTATLVQTVSRCAAMPLGIVSDTCRVMRKQKTMEPKGSIVFL